MKRRLSCMALVAVAGCAPQYAYVPETNATASMQGRPAAEYPIPPDAPQGDVRVASYGLTEVSPRKALDQVLRALHLRIVVSNNGAATWTFDTREQRVELQGGRLLSPAFASANQGSAPPLVAVGPSQKRVVDLFFLLPIEMQRAEAIPEFDALWRLHAGTTLVAERTPFERLAVDPDNGWDDDWDYGDGYYWGEPYWLNPEFDFGVYPYSFVGGGFVIHRAPHFGGGFHGGPRGGGGFHGGGGHGGGHR